ncbi:putative ATP-grasp superfamily ATP-dependent carboligase [Ornithinimicrobium humiphilum]|uniref:Putative ATP-grasp superfamily ATP-dependent carboligase n=1 Tax=Ornithinimicrobium humiphilum TaxID=125288 RepID=A0A543KMX2_9MICO|nr:PAC2 family protein [Ornithinimicrobium humiphilum]TQM96394.1 putative ATP-grasp superfamily ATP-dependent carboligase [Ornithinimicrobium humiphilum]
MTTHSPLFRLEADASRQPQPAPLMLVSLEGFIDAGMVRSSLAEHLLDTLDHEVVARFDVDSLVDYRSRRPLMTFDVDHYADYEEPTLVLYRMQDAAGEPFLLLHGVEPDFRWEGFVEAVRQLCLAFGVRRVVGAHGIPMAVPHTRPVGMTRFSSDRELLGDHTPLFGSVKVPGSAEALLHLRLAEAGLTSMGVAVHVPHYLAETQFGDAVVAAVDAIMDLTGLVLPTAELIAMAGVTRARIESELDQNEGAREVVEGLERRYDHFVEGQRRRSLLAAEASKLPTADEIGAELEKFLQDPDVAGPAPQEPSDEAGTTEH